MPWVTANLQNIFNVVLRGQTASPAFPGPGTGNVFLGLFTVAPNIDGAGFTEVTSTLLTGYTSRQPITFGPATGPARVVSNSNILTATLSAAGGPFPFTIRSGGVFTSATFGAGTMLAYGALATELPVNLGSLVQIPVGLLTIADNVVT